MAERTGLEPATPCVTGRYSNQLNYRSTEFFYFTTTGCHPGLLQFDAWQFMNHFVIHPSGRCFATFKSFRFCPALCRVVNCLKGQCHTSNLMPGSSLLSHGETPHYHRRYGVSLLSSAWGQVGPPRYGRQANSFVLCTQFFIASAALAALVKSVTYFCMLLPFLRLPPCCCANYCVLNSESVLKIVRLLIRQNSFGVVRLSLTVH